MRRLANQLDEINKKQRTTNEFILSRYEEAIQPITQLTRGDQIVDDIRRSLQEIDKIRPRTFRQRECHEELLSSQAAFIYGDCFIANQKRILKRNRWKQFSRATILSAPRRFGKSEMIAMFIAACLHSCPNVACLCISANETAADDKTGIIFKVRFYLNAAFGIVKTHDNLNNAKGIMLRYSSTDIRKIVSKVASKSSPDHPAAK